MKEDFVIEWECPQCGSTHGWECQMCGLDECECESASKCECGEE